LWEKKNCFFKKLNLFSILGVENGFRLQFYPFQKSNYFLFSKEIRFLFIFLRHSELVLWR